MSYASRQRLSTSATSQPISRPTPRMFFPFTSGAAARASMLYLRSPSLSLSETGPRPQPSPSRQPAQDCLHRQVAHYAGPPAAALCRADWSHLERNRQPRFDRNAQPRAEAWLNGGHTGRRVRFISNIISIVCSLRNSHKLTNCWSPTNTGPCATPRR
jgi:hypothetical protein